MARRPPKRKPREETEHILGNLDTGTRLIARPHYFAVQKQRKEGGALVWVVDGYYTTLAAALAGYAKRALRGSRVSQVNGDLDRLVRVVQDLDSHVAVVGEQLDLMWKGVRGGNLG